MIRYQDNPNLPLKTVKTASGKTEYRKNCRKFKDKYYVLNEECFRINDKWYANTSKLITLDYETGRYVILKETPLVYGIVNFEETGNHIFGYFTQNKYNNVIVNIAGYGPVTCYHKSVLEKAGYMENISDGLWYSTKNLNDKQIARLKIIESQKQFREKGYNIEDNGTEFQEKIDAFAAYPLKVSKNAMRFARYLGDTTFGCEIETALGYLPDNEQWKTGVVICRDGSIDNAEYVTIPLKGAKGLQNLKNLSEELMKRTTCDIKCSLHFHLGTLPSDRLFLTALYALGIRIQEELYQMFPYFKTKWEGIKKQDYNQKLRKLGIATLKSSDKEAFKSYVDDAYYRLFKWLNDGQEPDDRFNRTTHAHTQSAKWNRRQRYYWMNFMNMFFSERKTIEFRLHEATLNHHKMIPWLFICNAIVKYAEINAKAILSTGEPLSLNTVLDYYATHFKTEDSIFLSDYLKAYVAERKQQFVKDRKAEDYESNGYLKLDKTYTFKYKDTTGII